MRRNDLTMRIPRICALLLLLATWALLPRQAIAQHATSSQEQQGQNQQENQFEDQSQDQMQESATQNVCPFFGKIARKGIRFYLQDPIHKQTYELDDSWLARRHMGTNVLVKGSLDSDSKLIRVKSIANVHSRVVPRCDS